MSGWINVENAAHSRTLQLVLDSAAELLAEFARSLGAQPFGTFLPMFVPLLLKHTVAWLVLPSCVVVGRWSDFC